MKKAIFFLALIFINSGWAFSQIDSNKHSVFQVTFFPPMGTQGAAAKEYTNDFSLNILAGISQNERKFTLGSLGNIIKNDASGFQLAGIANVVGHNTNGVQLAGVFNTVRNDGRGSLISGIFNASKNYSGFQMGGVANVAADMKGFQMGGVMNMAKEMNGFQFASVANVADNVKGVQFAGVVNKAKNVEGLQFAALLNIADNSDYPFGLINIIKNGEMGIGITCNEIGSTVLSFRSGGRVLYGILGVGYNYRSVSKESFVVEGGMGAHINFTPTFRINTEAKASFFSAFSKKETTQYGLSILPALRLGSNFEVFAGPSVNYLHSDNMKNKDLFPQWDINIWEKYNSTDLKQVYVGFTFGTQYIF